MIFKKEEYIAHWKTRYKAINNLHPVLVYFYAEILERNGVDHWLYTDVIDHDLLIEAVTLAYRADYGYELFALCDGEKRRTEAIEYLRERGFHATWKSRIVTCAGGNFGVGNETEVTPMSRYPVFSGDEDNIMCIYTFCRKCYEDQFMYGESMIRKPHRKVVGMVWYFEIATYYES